MAPSGTSDLQPLESFHDYLLRRARFWLDPRLWSRCDPEDLVQEALAKAHEAREGFRGQTQAEQKAWLRRILFNLIQNTLRSIRPEPSLNAILEQASTNLGSLVKAQDSTPSERAHRNDMAERLEEALETLSPRQQLAVTLKYFHRCSQAEICQYLQTSGPAVAGLLHRALAHLRGVLPKSEQS